MDPVNFEDAIRYVFDRCEPHGVSGAHVNPVVSARQQDDWSRVAQALSRAIERIQTDAIGIVWTDNERASGGIEPNFSPKLQQAAEALKHGADLETVFDALTSMTHAMRALAIKAKGEVPNIYRGNE